MSLATSSLGNRLRLWAKTAFTVGMYMGCGDILYQNVGILDGLLGILWAVSHFLD